MEGLYDSIVDEDGGLLDRNNLLVAIDSDTYECIEQMYGMIWWLLQEHVLERNVLEKNRDGFMNQLLQDAIANYHNGLSLSPTERFQPFDEGPYEQMSIEDILSLMITNPAHHAHYPLTPEWVAKLIENRNKEHE